MSEAYARFDDPDTSQDAADDLRGKKANVLEGKVLAAIKKSPLGLTNHEIVTATGLDWNTSSPRVRPLVRKNLVYDSGERRPGPGGKKCIVWKAVIPASVPIEQIELL